jgi:uncharacterized protein GlcG (DUF336 family)
MAHDLETIVTDIVKQVLGGESSDVKAVPTVKNSMTKMTLSAAKKTIEAVEKKALEMGVKAVTAISDAGGNPIAVESMDDAFIASYDIAVNKAFTVVSLKMPTKNLASLAAPGGSLYGIQFTNGGKIVIFGGGVPLYSKSGKIIGGLGVSGGSEGEDTALAEFGGEVFDSLI